MKEFKKCKNKALKNEKSLKYLKMPKTKTKQL